jgi:hypothetical protein
MMTIKSALKGKGLSKMSDKKNSTIPLDQFLDIRHVDEIMKADENSWWVQRRSIGVNGKLSSQSRIVFFAHTQAAAEQWIRTQ